MRAGDRVYPITAAGGDVKRAFCNALPALEFDFAFSSIVFQHIPSRDIIESYLHEVNRLLRPGALFKLEVHGTTEPKHGAIRRIAAPGLQIMVPSRHRHQAERTWLGLTVTPEDARRLADATGFESRHQHGSQEQNYWLWLFKRALSSWCPLFPTCGLWPPHLNSPFVSKRAAVVFP